MTPSKSLATGIVLTLIAGAIFAGMDALGKYLTTLIPVMQVIWARYLVQTLVLSGYLAATTGTAFLKTRRPILQLLRGMSLLTATFFMYQALARVPLADATSVLFFSPILVTVYSTVFLKERIGLQRVLAVLAALLGMLLILRPGFGEMDPALLLALVASIFNACYLLLTRRLAGTEDAASTQFNTTAVGAIVLSVLVLPGWEAPDPWILLLLLVIGAAGAVGHFTLVSAFSHASASLLSPFLYAQILAAGAISILVFGDPLRITTVLGTAILVASGIYIWWRENRVSARAQ